MTNKDTIFYLEKRGSKYMYHFFVYNLAGLYYILNNKYNIRYGNDSALTDNENILKKINNNLNIDVNNLQKPIKIYIDDILDYHKETFDIIKDKFELINNISENYDCNIISLYGGNVIKDNITIEDIHVINFLRNLFLERLNYKFNNRKIYITRKNSEKYHNGCLRRHIINENDMIELLKKYNIDYIQLDNYNMNDKIKIFMESELIISSNSSALTLLLFANNNSKIIEIVNKGDGLAINQYKNISKILHLNYNRYKNINEDQYGNYNLDINNFEKYLQNILSS